jgi:sterol 3beta-glucosyltransferase
MRPTRMGSEFSAILSIIHAGYRNLRQGGALRFTVVSYGSEGDTRPIAAVCRGLLQAGHEVLMFCEQSSIAVARSCGVPAEALPGDIKATLPLDDTSTELRGGDIIKIAKAGIRVVNDNTLSWMGRLTDHARSSDAVIHSGLTMLIGPTIGQGLNKPDIALMLQPLGAPTREFPSALFPPLRLPGWLNRLTYGVSRAFIQRLYGKATRAARRQLFGVATSAELKPPGAALYGISRHLVARPSDWPDTHQICGAWTFAAADWAPPPDLLEFLAAGEPPIYVGFGAPSSFVREKGRGAIVSAIAGRRAVFYPGWSRVDASMLPSNFFVAGHTEHSWLFPRMSLVIHHAGAGTTHSACRAGVPSVALPFGVDQPFWAGRLNAVGVAPNYIRANKIEARSLASMIEFAQRDSIRARARELGAAMAVEAGVTNAVRGIEKLVGVK